MDRASQEFLERLEVGPSFLLLGQALFVSAEGEDPALREAVGAVRVDSLARLDFGARDAAYSRLAEICRGAAPPTQLRALAEHRWNGVFTSQIDSRVTQLFAAEWRRVTSVVGDQRPRHPRSSIDLAVRYLYGSVNEPDDRQPPRTNTEQVIRRSEANDLLSELVTTLITPRGVLAIDGWVPSDWLSAEDLYAAIRRLQPGQAHLFNARDAIASDELLADAVNKGVLVPRDQSLSDFLEEAQAEGRFGGATRELEPGSRVLRLAGALVPVPRDEWSRILPSARPIDIDLLTPPTPLSGSLLYQRFRQFLGHSDGTPDWTGVTAGYPFRREFEERLLDRVTRHLAEPEVTSPIIVEGQAGSGKSVALTVLAARIAAQGQVAVLYAGRFAERPSVPAIDEFALWAEEMGATATLLVWDGMVDVDDYHSAHHQLRSRGRKVLIVGSCYRLANQRAAAESVPATLEGDEPGRIQVWLARFGVELADSDLAVVGTDASFLAALYRLLPDSRQLIERGLTLELRTVESDMERFSRSVQVFDGPDLTIMAAALARAGVELPAFTPGSDDRTVADRNFAERSTAEQLSGIVLVSGRRGMRVPLELVLRVVGRQGSAAVLEVVRHFDIIRWSDDENGEQYLGARTALEAELLARADFRDHRAEAEVIRSLLQAVKPTAGSGGPEAQFALDLLRQIGPSSSEEGRFWRHYMDFAEALEASRDQMGFGNPRLMLMEANLRREYIRRLGDEHLDEGVDERIALLAGTRKVLELALDGAPSPLVRLNLLTELASTLGTEAYERSRGGEGLDPQVERIVDQIVRLVNEARSLDPENYYPIDVIAWVCTRIVKQNAVNAEAKVALVADMLATFSSIDPDVLSPKQRANYDSRRAHIAELLRDPAVAERHLLALRDNQDASALYLLSLHASQLLYGTTTRETAQAGLEMLLSQPDTVRIDWRCSRLALDLFWIARTGNRFLGGEREALPFDDDDWNDCLDILDKVSLSTADEYRGSFLRGLALFHLRKYRLALEVFRDLERTSVTLSRRIIATYVLSSSTGEPVRFSGQVRYVTPDNRRGRVWVETIGQELPFIPYRFSREEFTRGDQLPAFYIAFNFRGVYADPVRTAQPIRQTKEF